MFEKKDIMCCDCGRLFTTRANNKLRCDSCQRIHHIKNNRVLYEKRKAELAALHKEEREQKIREEMRRRKEEKPLLLNLPCPWADGRLPESVRRNQLWG